MNFKKKHQVISLMLRIINKENKEKFNNELPFRILICLKLIKKVVGEEVQLHIKRKYNLNQKLN